MDDRQIISCDGLLGNANGILGLFIPQYRDLQIKVKNLHQSNEPVRRIIDSLVPDDKSAKTTLILFARPYGYDGTILEQIKRTYVHIFILQTFIHLNVWIELFICIVDSSRKIILYGVVRSMTK